MIFIFYHSSTRSQVANAVNPTRRHGRHDEGARAHPVGPKWRRKLWESLETDAQMAGGEGGLGRPGLALLLRLIHPTMGGKEPSLMTESAPIFDIVIAGAGVSGLALAAAVKQAMGSGVSIAAVDPAPAPAPGAPRLRAVAIADGPRRLMERIGAWQAIEPQAQAILTMAIMDGRTRDAIRPTHLNFAAKSAPLAHMAFNDDVVGALAARCDRLEVQRFAASVARWSASKSVATLGLSDGRSFRARLAVAADG